MITLRDYQIDISSRAVDILRQHKIVCLAVEVRCGKTLISLEAARKYGAKKVLFVTKLKAISSIEQDAAALQPEYHLTIINFESLHTVIDVFDFVIVDECHKTAAFPKPSVATKLLRQIIGKNPCILMSGTFTPESYSQIYHILWVSENGPFAASPNFYKWAAEYVTVKKKYYYNREIKDYSNADKDKIGLATSHLFLSFTQSEAGFEQSVVEEIVTVQMSEGTYLLADYIRRHRVYIGREGQELLADTEVKLMQKLHQIYSGSVIDETGQGNGFDLTKAWHIKKHFAGQKIGVFYKFKAERLMLITVFGADRITEDPMEFNSCADKVFISQFQSGREGINLMTADCLIGFNIDFSAVTYWQFRARMQDKNRTKEAKLYWIFAEGGIESKIYERVLEKKDYTLSHFKRDYKLKATPMSNMAEQVSGFMKAHGIEEIQIGSRKIKRDRA